MRILLHGNSESWDRILETMTQISHARNICCLFLTQVFRKRQNDIIACENYHTFREYDPWDFCEVGIMRNGGSGKWSLGYADIRKNANYVKW